MAPVQRELGLDDVTLALDRADQGDRLGAAVREHEPVGIDADRRGQRGGGRSGVRIPVERTEVLGDHAPHVRGDGVQARRQVEHVGHRAAQPRGDPAASPPCSPAGGTSDDVTASA